MLLAAVAIIAIRVFLKFYKKEHFIDEGRLIVKGRDIMAELDYLKVCD
jgi:hypothetical protein